MTFDFLVESNKAEIGITDWTFEVHGRWGISFRSNDGLVVVVASQNRQSKTWQITARAAHEYNLRPHYVPVNGDQPVEQVLQDEYDKVVNRIFSPMELLDKKLRRQK